MHTADSLQTGSAARTIAIETRELSRRFGSFVAVDRLSMQVPSGCFYGFLGPNGAGKSTTIRMLTGLLAPSEGDALIEGTSIVSDPVAVKRRIGVLPDDLALFDRLSFWEHLTMVGRIYGLSVAETESRAEDLLRLLDLWEDRGAYAVDGSHGMRKKLALSIALIHSPRVLFLDEPFEGVDPIAGAHIRDMLRRLIKRGVTIFLTSHILEVVERLADRVGIIVHSRMAAETDLADLRDAGRSLEDLFMEAAGGSREEARELPWLT